mmetsp:Transcript_65747/g.148347  ORF Transcript_65747/g.148347 Transcript_65747/m.148347 type:complete len:510 (-) Transcript_65747:123-1652(-)
MATAQAREVRPKGQPEVAKTLQPASTSYLGETLALLRLTWPLMLGNTLEWYEFGVYAYVEAELQKNFFGGSASSTWLGFAVTFVARPLGGFALGWIADNWGRRLSVNLSLAGMLLATVGQGLLPGEYLGRELKNLGLVLLIILRAVQGLSAGGEIGAISSYLVEVGNVRNLGMAVCFISVGSQIAWASASAGIAALTALVGPEAMLVWGWRVPFVIAIFPGLIALWGRNSIPETEAFLQEVQQPAEGVPSAVAAEREPAADPGAAGAKPQKCAAAELALDHGLALCIGAGSTVAVATMWFVPPFWTVSALLGPHLGAVDSLWISNTAQLVGLAVTPFAGWLTDTCGVGFVTATGALFFALVGLPTYVWLSHDPTSRAVAYVCVGLIYGTAQGFSGSTIYLFCAELFPARLRCMGLALSYNIAVSFVGGFGASICQALFSMSPRLAPGIYFSACGAVSVVSVFAGLVLQHNGRIRLTHRRAEPYFRAPCMPERCSALADSPVAGEGAVSV